MDKKGLAILTIGLVSVSATAITALVVLKNRKKKRYLDSYEDVYSDTHEEEVDNLYEFMDNDIPKDSSTEDIVY